MSIKMLELKTMLAAAISETQIFTILGIAIVPAFLALLLGSSLARS